MITAVASQARFVRHPLATIRILRLALGTSLCLVVAQSFGWMVSFLAPLFTFMLLGLPIPPLNLKKGIAFVAILVAPMLLGMGLLPFLEHARWAGIGLSALALFYSFYFTAKGGSPAVGTFATIGLTIIVTIGSVSPELVGLLIPALALNATCGLVFVWISHLLLPDPPPDPALARPSPPSAPRPGLAEARRSAVRSLAVVLPLALTFLYVSGSPAYSAVMIKVASLGQQSNADQSRAMGQSLLASTFWGGIGAVICWQILAIWPSLLIYALLLALACLVYGRFVFAGPALHEQASMASYAVVTLIILLGPAVSDGPTSDGASSAFWTRLLLFVVIAVYGTVSVRVFDAFWPAGPAESAKDR